MDQTAGRALDPAVLAAPWRRGAVAGFVYWLAILLALQPGNFVRAIEWGRSLNGTEETIRILVASLLGAIFTPVTLWAVRRFRIERARLWPNLALHGIIAGVVVSGLILTSCVLAFWFLPSEGRPLGEALAANFAVNGGLLAMGVAGFTGISHALIAPWPVAGRIPLQRMTVASRGRFLTLDMQDVDWIESQGNYAAVHMKGAVHLIRQPLAILESRLDPDGFVRIHRGAIVALDRVAAFRPTRSGDAEVVLTTGQTLRVSRGFKAKARERITRRAGTHNEGADLLKARLDGKIAIDHETARRLFTLVTALYRRG